MKRPIVVALSGVDGTGKSSAAQGLVTLLSAERGTARHYLYGCIVCRRSRRTLQDAIAKRGGRAPWWAGLHAVVDAVELILRLRVLTARLRTGSSRRRPVLVTDRGPLDGLVKHRPASSRMANWLLRRALDRYDLMLWLRGDPETLAARDLDHTSEHLAATQDRYAEVVGTLEDRIEVIDVVTSDASAVLDTLVDRIRALG